MINKLEALSYLAVMNLLIESTRRRRDKLLSILPDSFAVEIKKAFCDQSNGKKSGVKVWRQKYENGLADHCVRKIVETFDLTDEEITSKFLEPLELVQVTDEVISAQYIHFLLSKYHNSFKWCEENLPISREVILGQFYHSTDALRRGFLVDGGALYLMVQFRL
jgi:hypothetical protein